MLNTIVHVRGTHVGEKPFPFPQVFFSGSQYEILIYTLISVMQICKIINVLA